MRGILRERKACDRYRLRRLALPVAFHHTYHPYHARTFTLYRDYAAHAISRHGYANTRNKRGTRTLGVRSLYHKHACKRAGDRPYASYLHFQPGTRTYNSTAERYKASQLEYLSRVVYFRVIEADHS